MHPIEKPHLENHRLGIGRLLIEMAMVVFSILLALNLESCKERRHEKELERTALHNIRLEMEQNRNAIAKGLPKHKEMAAGLEKDIQRLAVLQSKSAKPLPEESLWAALQPTVLFQKAWETATLTRALAKTDYTMVMGLSAVYEAQRWMTLIEDKWLQTLLNPASFEMPRRIWFLSILLTLVSNYVQIEENLLKGYDEILGTLLPKGE